MAGRTEHQAIKAFVSPIQKALSRFTKANVRPSAYRAGEEPLVLLLNNAEPVRLSGDRDLTLYAMQWFRVIEHEGPRGPFKVRTVGYQYELARDAREVFAYHWHPDVGPWDYPHAHVADSPLGQAHVPCGRVPIEQVLLLAHELGAEPLMEDWKVVLKDAIDRFDTWKTW